MQNNTNESTLVKTPHRGISTIEDAEIYLEQHFKSINDIEQHNFDKVLRAFTENQVGEQHFSWVTGYGHDDLGRQKLDQVFAQIFNAEHAVVRPSFVSGTHTISCCLFGCLGPGDELVSICGEPYDTLHPVIGIGGNVVSKGSLRELGISYKEIPLKDNYTIDFEAIPQYLSAKTKMVFIQRSKGYHWRKSATIEDIKKIISIVKSINKNIICFVDNCFGEFTEKYEPTDVGADITCGSLIKNIGGGIVPAGGYIVGKKELVKSSAQKLTAPGIGDKGGCMFDLTRVIFQGLFYAPHIVSQILKGILLTSYFFQNQGYEVNPLPTELKTDIVVAIKLKNRLLLENICKTVQANSPVNSHLTPVPCKLPGYEDEVIMAGGTFIEGSTIELSCDAPIREPYILYWQGGLSYFHTKHVLTKIFAP